MNSAFGLIKLFLTNSKVRLQREMEYRSNYIFGVFISIIASAIPALFQYLIFTQTRGFPGWTLEQIILFQGLLLVIVGLRNTLFGEVQDVVTDLVRKGTFDRLLLKPYPPIGTILVSGFSANRVGTLITGIIIAVYAADKIGLSIGPFQLLLFIASLLCGLAFFVSILIIYCAVTLLIIYMGGIWDLIQNILIISQYPAEIFPKAVQTVFITIVPFMVMVYFPAQILLNRLSITLIFAFAVSFIFLFASLVLWNRCLKKYTSAGG